MLLSLNFALSALAASQTILVVGDSLSAAYGIDAQKGWVQLLQSRLQEQKFDYRVVNASISGDTAGGGAGRLPALLKAHRPNVVIVELGGNDGLRGLSPAEINRQLTIMVRAAQATGAKVLLLGMKIPPNYGKTYTDQFEKVYRDVAARERVPLVPFLLDGIGANRKLMQGDGIHPTAEAQGRMLENVWGQLKSLL